MSLETDVYSDLVAPSSHEEVLERLPFYDRFVVMFSGGKDSLACVLHLLSLGVDASKIELWHHEIDGREGNHLMDWPSTPSYCRRVADAFGIPLLFSWKVGGFEREMLRSNATTAPIQFEDMDGTLHSTGGLSTSLGRTRNVFPQTTADLTTRWCSSYIKIDVGNMAIRNQSRFNNSRTLVLTGERAEESPARAKRGNFERHKTDTRDGKNHRHVDHWRPVHGWSTAQVWDIIAKYRVNPHPAYRLGWGRLSCMKCIFGSCNQWATIQAIDPAGFETIAQYEERFGLTIHRKLSVREQAGRGTVYPQSITHPEIVLEAMQNPWTGTVILPAGEWRMPEGAFGESCGPI